MTDREDYVSRIVAEWLGRRGFDWPCRAFYESDGRFSRTPDGSAVAPDDLRVSGRTAAPTLQTAAKWLREEHGIDIIVFREKLQETRYWARVERHPCTLHRQEPVYLKHEDSMLAAVDYALTDILG